MHFTEWIRRTHAAVQELPPAERPSYLTLAQVEAVMRSSLTVLTTTLEAGEDLRLHALGRLWVEEKPPQARVSNLGGRSAGYTLPARQVVRFRVSARLARRVNSSLMVMPLCYLMPLSSVSVNSAVSSCSCYKSQPHRPSGLAAIPVLRESGR
jgi:nucleoid DNA-binding protein